MEHTKTPWEHTGHGCVMGGEKHEYVGGSISSQIAMFCGGEYVGPDELIANAEFAVRACNSHDRMRETLESIATGRVGWRDARKVAAEALKEEKP